MAETGWTGRSQTLSQLTGLGGRGRRPEVVVGEARKAAAGAAGLAVRSDGHLRAKWSVPRQMPQGLAGPGQLQGRVGQVSVP